MRNQQSAVNPFTVELERRDFSGLVNLDCVIQPVTLAGQPLAGRNGLNWSSGGQRKGW